MIRNAEDLVEKLQNNHNLVQYMVDLCGGDEIDIGDLIAVIYDGMITPDKKVIREYLNQPILKKYIGETNPPKGGLLSLLYSAEKLVPHDKGKVVLSILERRLTEYRRKKLGTRPTSEQKKDYLEEIADAKKLSFQFSL